MIRVEIVETVHRPIQEVFEQLVDIPRYAEWMPDTGLFISSTKDSKGPVGLGTRYTDRIRFGSVKGEIIEFQRPTRVVFRYTGRLFGRAVIQGSPGYTLEPTAAGGTRLHHHAEARLYGPFKLFQPLVQALARGERRRTVHALKRSLESAGPAAASDSTS